MRFLLGKLSVTLDSLSKVTSGQTPGASIEKRENSEHERKEMMTTTTEAEAVATLEVAIAQLLVLKLSQLPKDAQDAVESIIASPDGKLLLEIELPLGSVRCSAGRGDHAKVEAFSIPGDPGRRFFPPISKMD